jgi:hypothetical protein
MNVKAIVVCLYALKEVRKFICLLFVDIFLGTEKLGGPYRITGALTCL